MPLLDTSEITFPKLLERGWTRTLIKRFLPTADGRAPVNHWKNYRGQDTYATIRVWHIEQSDEFRQAFLQVWKGRTKGRLQGRSPEIILAELRSEPVPDKSIGRDPNSTIH